MATKPKFSVTKTTCNGDDNMSREDERPLSPLEEGDYSGNSGGIVHVSDDPNIKLVRESDVTIVLDVDDEMNRVTFARPLLTITPRLVKLCSKMDDAMHEHAKRVESQLPPNNIEVS